MKAVLDTSILIDAMKEEPGAQRYLESLEAGSGLYSAVTLCELVTGTRPEEEHKLESFLSALRLCDVTGEIARQAGRLRRQDLRGELQVPDSIIAATAIVYNAILVSRDRDHFAIEGLEVVSPTA